MSTRRFVATQFVILWIAVTAITFGQSDNGTIVMRVAEFTTEGVKIKKRDRHFFDSGSMSWGVNGDTILVTQVSTDYINLDPVYQTRYGQERMVELSPGTYRLSCAGLVLESSSRSVKKLLSKSAFFNEGVVSLEALPGSRIEIEVLPIIIKQGTWMVKLKIPTYKVTARENGELKYEGFICDKTEQSVPWDSYTGPLKFSGN